MKSNYIYLLILCLLSVSACSTIPIKENSTDLSQFEVKSYPLTEDLVEISALENYIGDLFGLNDSGGEPEIYRISSPTPTDIKQTIRLENAANVDWESLALSDSIMFIGDFGNNLGNRNDLTIYFFPLSHITSEPMQVVKNKKFKFFYPEQEIYENHAYNHDYDMESMVYHNKKLHLFTKEWKSNRTRHYTLDLVKGNQPAWLVEELELDFMVTGADIIRINNSYTRLGLVGYNRDGDVQMLITDFKTNGKYWLDNPKFRINLGFAGEVGQVEGIAFKSANDVCFSAEKITMDDMTRDQNITCFSITQ